MQPLSTHKRDKHMGLDGIGKTREPTRTHTHIKHMHQRYLHTHQTHASKVPNLLLDMKLRGSAGDTRLQVQDIKPTVKTLALQCRLHILWHKPTSSQQPHIAISPRVTHVVTVLAQIQSFWCRDPTAALHIDGTEIHINGPHCPL